MKNFLIKSIPWIITVAALYYAFSGLDLDLFWEGLLKADYRFILLAVICTILSYLMRAFRWKYFFPNSKNIPYAPAAEVLFLGFFMNNILPARAGEFVRAHLGSKKFQEKRTLVLATIASERLIDGLTISALFLLVASNIVHGNVARNLLYVVSLFFIAGLGILFLLLVRKKVFVLADKVSNKVNHRASHYINNRFQLFIESLKPIFQPKRVPFIATSSLAVWFMELCVYISITLAFGMYQGIPICVLFLVAVNFSSLIPSAPGAIGVIEAVSTAVLMSVGLDKHTALAMVITQHVIQYIVVGIPGLILMLRWKVKMQDVPSDNG